MQNLTFPSSWFSSGAQTNNGKKLNQLHHHPAALKPQPAASLFGGGYATNPQYMWRSAAGSHQLAPNSKRRSMDAKEAFGLDGSLPSQPVVPPLGGAINNNINISINNTNNVGPGTGRRSSLPGVMPSSTGGLGAYPLPISPLSAGGGAGATATSAAAKKMKSGISGKLQHTPEQKEAGKGRWIVVMSRCIVLFFFTFCLGLSMAEERFGVLSRLGCVFAPENNAESLRQMDKYILAVVVSFGMSFVIDFLGALYSVSREKRLLYTLSSSVHLLGGTTKVLLYLRALPVLVDFAGRPLYMVHYLQWYPPFAIFSFFSYHLLYTLHATPAPPSFSCPPLTRLFSLPSFLLPFRPHLRFLFAFLFYFYSCFYFCGLYLLCVWCAGRARPRC
jgi:hypothetical protein